MTQFSQVAVLLQIMVWDGNRQWVGTSQSHTVLPQSEIPLAIDNVYDDLQSQVNDTGGTVVVMHKFDQNEATYREQYPPKVILPIVRRGLIQRVTPIVGDNN